MSEILQGDRIGRLAQIRVGVAAFVQDEAGRILVTRRADNGRWCLPGGHVDHGETVAEACARETLEETGLVVEIGQLIGVYSSPDYVVAYPDGNQVQFISLTFRGTLRGGEASTSNETTEVGFYTPDEVRALDLLETHRMRIEDALIPQESAYVR
jgi:ADP-ribose pyrophosphatase YjhB (NUDIX family)